MKVEKTKAGWLLDDQGFRVLFDFRELARLGIKITDDPWAEHKGVAMANADVLYNAALRGRGERIREVWRRFR